MSFGINSVLSENISRAFFVKLNICLLVFRLCRMCANAPGPRYDWGNYSKCFENGSTRENFSQKLNPQMAAIKNQGESFQWNSTGVVSCGNGISGRLAVCGHSHANAVCHWLCNEPYGRCSRKGSVVQFEFDGTYNGLLSNGAADSVDASEHWLSLFNQQMLDCLDSMNGNAVGCYQSGFGGSVGISLEKTVNNVDWPTEPPTEPWKSNS